MKKITFKRDEEKRKRRNQVILGVVLIFIMFSSTIGYAFQSFGGGTQPIDGSGAEAEVINGFEFTQQNGFWIMNFNGMNLIFTYSPDEIFGLNSELNGLINYEARPLYVYSDSVNAESEIRVNMFDFVNRIENACPEGMGNCTEQIKTCDENFIIIRESESRDIRQEQNCVFIEGGNSDLAKLTDEFLYEILGVA